MNLNGLIQKASQKSPEAAPGVPERRQDPRAAVETGMQLQSGAGILCQVTDASLRGLSFQTWIELKEGDQIPFRLSLPGVGSVAGKLRICWRESMPGLRPWRYGARVSFADASSQEALKEFITPQTPAKSAVIFGRLDSFLTLVIEKKPVLGLVISALGPVALIWVLQFVIQQLMALASVSVS